MAKSSSKQNGNKSKLPIPGFRDVPKESVDRAAAALAGGNQDPLKVPANASTSVDGKGVERSRWTESVLITNAYRSVTKKGLMDVVIKGKIRQSKTKENTGRTVFGHFYKNMAADVPENHVGMNERSDGAIHTFLIATGLMPSSGSIKASLLEKLFPQENAPNANSPLRDKVVTVVIVQALEPKKDKNGKVVLDKDGDEILVPRDQIEKALPPISEDADEDEDEDSEDEDDSDDSEDADEDDSEDEDDESDDDEEDDDDGDGDDDAEEDEDDEEEEEAPAPAPVKKPSRRK